MCILRLGVVMAEFERTWRLTKGAYSVHAEVPAQIYDAMLRILDCGFHRNLSDYMRDLIEKDVEERGIELAPLESFGGEGIGELIRDLKTVDTRVIHTRIPIPMRDMINGLLESGRYLSVSDYLRDVIKKDLESRGIKPRPIEAGEEKTPAKMWRPSATATVSTQLPMPMIEDIDRLLASGLYLRVSDYLIDLIRKDLEARVENR